MDDLPSLKSMGDACLISAQTLLVIFERIRFLEGQLQFVLQALQHLEDKAQTGNNVYPNQSSSPPMVPSPLRAKPTNTPQPVQGSSTPVCKFHLSLVPSAVVLNIPYGDAFLWSTKIKTIRALSKLLKVGVELPALLEFFFLPSRNSSKRLYLAFDSAAVVNLIFHTRTHLGNYNITIQRTFKQTGNSMSFKLKPQKPLTPHKGLPPRTWANVSHRVSSRRPERGPNLIPLVVDSDNDDFMPTGCLLTDTLPVQNVPQLVHSAYPPSNASSTPILEDPLSVPNPDFLQTPVT